MRPQLRLLLPLFLGWLVIATFFVVNLGGGGEDDAFVTYRYARSVAHGHGLVFNIGERYFGPDEMGFGLVLGGLHRLTGISIPWLGTMTTALAVLLIGFVMTADGLEHDRVIAAALGSTLLVGSTIIWASHGTAAPLVLALLLAAARLAEEQPEIAGVLAGGAVWLRPDAVLGVLALGLLLGFRNGKSSSRFGVAAGLVIIAGLGLAWHYFRALFPSGPAAGQIMAELRPDIWPSGLGFWSALLSFWSSHFGIFAIPMLLVGTVGWLWARKIYGLPGQLLALYAAGLLVAYPLFETPFSPQKIVAVATALIFGFSCFVSEITRRLLRQWKVGLPNRLLMQGLEIGIAVALVLVMAFRVFPLNAHYRESPHLTAYRAAAEWILDTTPPNTTVSYHEVGVIGWYSERPLYDLIGLVSPGLAQYPNRGTSYEMVVGLRSPEIVLDHTERRIGVLPSLDWFQQTYRAVASFPDAAGGEMVIYQKMAEQP